MSRGRPVLAYGHTGKPHRHSISVSYFFLRPALQRVVQLSRTPLLGAAVPRLIDLRWPGARSSGIARTRLIDDYISASLRGSVNQVVILGAGFDCRAYRIPGIEKIRVFEVDHPVTLSKKKEGVRHIFGALPKHVVYVDVDFNTQSLCQTMQDSGFNANERSFFIWEGVTNYLSEQAVDSTSSLYMGESTRKSRRFHLRAQRCARWLGDICRDSPRMEHATACRRNLDLRFLPRTPSGIPCRTWF